MSAHLLLNLLNELKKEIKCEGAEYFISFCNEFNKFNNAGAQMLDSILSYDIYWHPLARFLVPW